MKKIFIIFTISLFLIAEIVYSQSSNDNEILAILPFKNLTPHEGMDWLSEGIASTLVTKLSDAEDLIIVERHNIKKILDEIILKQSGITEETVADTGKMLGATIMAMGEFQYIEQNIKINVRLIDVNTGKIEGSSEVTGKLEDIFSLQNKLAFYILNLLDKAIEKSKPHRVSFSTTNSFKAFEEFSMAQKAWDGKTLESENIERAIEHYKKAIKYDPNYFLAYIELGNAFRVIGELRKALKWHQYALKIGKKAVADKNVRWVCRVKAYNSLSETYLQKKELDKAITSCKEAIEISPDAADSYILLGHVYRKKGELGRAISAYRKATEIEPNNPRTYYNLGIALMEKGEKKEAIESFKKTVEKDFPREFSNLARKYLEELIK